MVGLHPGPNTLVNLSPMCLPVAFATASIAFLEPAYGFLCQLCTFEDDAYTHGILSLVHSLNKLIDHSTFVSYHLSGALKDLRTSAKAARCTTLSNPFR